MGQILLTMCYCGTAYHGSQVQTNGITITQVLQNAIERVYGQRLMVKGCSRTDAGVHANMYTATFFENNKKMEMYKLVRALNFHLPADVRVYQAQPVDDEFHVRYSAQGKEYLYIVHDGVVADPFWQNREFCWNFRLNEKQLQQQADAFVGSHDFIAFTGSKNTQENTVRCVEYFKVQRQGERVYFYVKANGFLYNMVRIMVGTLLGIAAGQVKYSVDQLLQKKDRSLCGHTAPACGLYLNRVFYPDLQLLGREEERGYVPWQI